MAKFISFINLFFLFLLLIFFDKLCNFCYSLISFAILMFGYFYNQKIIVNYCLPIIRQSTDTFYLHLMWNLHFHKKADRCRRSLHFAVFTSGHFEYTKIFATLCKLRAWSPSHLSITSRSGIWLFSVIQCVQIGLFLERSW